MRNPYEDIKKIRDEMRDDLYEILNELDKNIVKGRDDKVSPVAIYSTKYRIKTASSIYLKTKRGQAIDEMTDLGGCRILCLFEEDIINVHKYLINVVFPKNGYILKIFKMFNCKSSDYIDIDYFKHFVEEYDKKHDSNTKIEPPVEGGSGYKSIHYIVKYEFKGVFYNIEIQLRTLFQDAWAELEHALSYKKGGVHPHIKKNFRMLARDLETKDMLISHLKNIYDKEQVTFSHNIQNIRPCEYFGYDKRPFSDKSTAQAKAFSVYYNYVKRKDIRKITMKQIKTAREYLNALVNLITGTTLVRPTTDVEKEIYYLVKIENAFLLFCEKKYNEALKEYKLLEDIDNKYYADRYVLNFRIGEIKIIEGNIEEALSCFDICENIIGTGDAYHLNEYRIKVKLAYVYWLLGNEYYDISVKEINRALELYEENEESFGKVFRETDIANLLNNICWYYWDELWHRLMKTGRITISALNKGEERYKKLVNFTETGYSVTSKEYDTMAWVSYRLYLINHGQDKLQKAKKFCDLLVISEHETSTGSPLYKDHIQTIRYALEQDKKGKPLPLQLKISRDNKNKEIVCEKPKPHL